MAGNRRDEPRNRWRDDDRPYRDYGCYGHSRRGQDYAGRPEDHAGAPCGRHDRDADHAARGYGSAQGYGCGEYTGGGPRRGRRGREEDYPAGYRNHYLMNHDRARDRAEYGQPDHDRAGRRDGADCAWSGDERRRRDALPDDEEGYRRGHGPYGRYRDDW